MSRPKLKRDAVYTNLQAHPQSSTIFYTSPQALYSIAFDDTVLASALGPQKLKFVEEKVCQQNTTILGYKILADDRLAVHTSGPRNSYVNIYSIKDKAQLYSFNREGCSKLFLLEWKMIPAAVICLKGGAELVDLMAKDTLKKYDTIDVIAVISHRMSIHESNGMYLLVR